MGKAVEPSQWLSLVASFALVLVLLLGTLWVLRRIGASGLRAQSGRRLAVVESLWLGNRQRVVLVRVDQREILLGVSAQGVTRLDAPVIGALPEAASPPCAQEGIAGESVVQAQSRVEPPAATARTRFTEAMRAITQRTPGAH